MWNQSPSPSSARDLVLAWLAIRTSSFISLADAVSFGMSSTQMSTAMISAKTSGLSFQGYKELAASTTAVLWATICMSAAERMKTLKT